MSEFDKPINYKTDVKMNYDKSLADDIDYINFKNNLLHHQNNKNNESNQNYDYEENEHQINPLFSPQTLISDQFDYNKKNKIKQKDFDPYINYINNKGLNGQNIKVRYNIEYVNIDSRNRVTMPQNIISKSLKLTNNPLTISNNELLISLDSLDSSILNTLNVGDKFSLLNLQPYKKIYMVYGDSDYANTQNTNPIPNDTQTSEPLLIQFFEGKSYAQININPNIYVNINTTQVDFSALYNFFDTTKATVTISGVKGVQPRIIYTNTSTSIQNDTYQLINNNKTQYKITSSNINNSNYPYIGNIPISFINQTHRIYITPPDSMDTLPNINKFYILLPWESNGTNVDTTSENYNVTFNFNHYNLIPVNELNADYPINTEHINGYHIITSVNTNYITCKLYPPIDLVYINSNNYTYPNFGNDNIYFNLIEKITYGYPDQNNYTITFDKIFNNVIQIRMIDSLIRNPSITFINSGSGKNNRLYFQNIEDIEEIQYIEITEGLYTIPLLKTMIETEFKKLSRKINIENFGYDLNYNVIVNIDTPTNIVSFESYKSKTLQVAITTITPSINQNDLTIGTGTYTIIIQHDNHGISASYAFGIFSGFIDHLGIQASDLNGKHYLSIIDSNRYSFVLTNINLTSTKIITNGGNNIKVFIPSPIKFYFNYSDTMGSVLGYRNPGYDTSITEYNYLQKNTDHYIGEISKDVNGIEIVLTNKSIKLNKYDYFLMMCNVPFIVNINNLTNVQTKEMCFAKFKITDDTLISNEYSNSPIFLYDPIVYMNQLGFTFYNPDKTLVDFKDRDHSFILEITTVDNLPELTSINPNISVKM